MSFQIFPSTYKNISCIVMESDSLVVKIIPESGGKIQSIFDKRLNKEYLVQSPHAEYIRSTYGSDYGAGDVSGFDEVFPSIEQCFYPLPPWQGTRVPDHGEVWALPWDLQTKDQSMTLSVNGVRFPYRLQKKVEFIRDNAIRLSYVAENLSHFDFYFAWAAHNLFVTEPGTRIVLPPSVNKVFSTCSRKNQLGKFGGIHDWPVTTYNGEPYDISDANPKYSDLCEKYYAMGQVAEGWCALHHPQSGATIGLSYPIDQVPYLGVWEGIMNNQYVTALEPCTGDLDFLDTAIQWGRCSVIKAKSKYEWYLNLVFDNVKKISSIDKNGIIIE